MPGGQTPSWGQGYASSVTSYPEVDGTMSLSVPNNQGQPTVTYSITGHTAAITASNYTPSSKQLTFTLQLDGAASYNFDGTWTPGQGQHGGFDGGCSKVGPGGGDDDWTANANG